MRVARSRIHLRLDLGPRIVGAADKAGSLDKCFVELALALTGPQSIL